MIDVQSVLKKAAEKCNLKRIRYKEKNLPTSVENIVVFPFFGDHRSNFVLSSLLLRRIKEELKSSKYFILVSWPGQEGLFPYVDEYWQVEDESVIEKLRSEVLGFENFSSVFTLMLKNLNQYFYDVFTTKEILPFYENGLTKDFFDRFKHVKVSLPAIPSSATLGADYARMLSQKELKVFLYPSKNIFSWKMGNIVASKAPKEFWGECVEKLVKNKFFPIVHTDYFSYDMSVDFTNDCLHLKNVELIKALGIMRASGCVLDFFNGISRYALCARTPFVCFDERIRFKSQKDYEINDLCGKRIPKEYIFGFSTIIENGDIATWNSNLFDHLIIKLNKIYEKMNRDSWPSSSESNDIVPYDSVRKIKNKKLGSRFVRIERD